LSLGGVMPRRLAAAGQEAAKADDNDNVLVVIELAGGNDGLNTLVPFENDLYYKHRPNLQIAKDQALRLNEYVGLHPALAAVHGLHNDGKLAIVQGVGYPEPERSHARSMEIWHTASTNKKPPESGWLGRVLDARFTPSESDLVPAMALTGSLPQAFRAEHWAVPAVPQLEPLAQANETRRSTLLRKFAAEPEGKEMPLSFLRRQAAAQFRALDKLKSAAANYEPAADYPGELGNQLRRAAQVIAVNLGVRIFFASQGGYDTHSQQAGTHQGLFQELGGAMAAFLKDLEAHKVADKVLVLVFSEFGRRVEENASGGTDHGAASVLFLAGNKVKAGLHGTYPSLEKDKLDDGDLVYTVDFRSVYATVLDKWMACSSEKLLGQKFPTLELVTV
jgi:uncharacterized protein (DUF1501 family)